MKLYEKARLFATAAHAAVKQMRKYTREPYIVHPTHVAELVARAGGDDAMVAAAFLHDVVEDTGVTIDLIRAEFGDDVANLVSECTDVSKKEDGNRAIRKEIDRRHTAAASPRGKTIKLADLISNTESITWHDPDFSVVYMKEKEQLLEHLKEGNTDLWNLAKKLVNDWKDSR